MPLFISMMARRMSYSISRHINEKPMKYFGNPTSSFRVSVEGVAFTSLLPPYVLFRFTIRI